MIGAAAAAMVAAAMVAAVAAMAGEEVAGEEWLAIDEIEGIQVRSNESK